MKCWAQRAVIISLKPTCMSVTIGLPWESVLGSILFNIFIYDLGNRAKGKFVDDTKPWGTVDKPHGCAIIQILDLEKNPFSAVSSPIVLIVPELQRKTCFCSPDGTWYSANCMNCSHFNCKYTGHCLLQWDSLLAPEKATSACFLHMLLSKMTCGRQVRPPIFGSTLSGKEVHQGEMQKGIRRNVGNSLPFLRNLSLWKKKNIKGTMQETEEDADVVTWALLLTQSQQPLPSKVWTLLLWTNAVKFNYYGCNLLVTTDNGELCRSLFEITVLN